MRQVFKVVCILSCLVCLGGCEKHYIRVTKVAVNKTSLASVFAQTPDPRKAYPPLGEELVIEWNLPAQAAGQKLLLDLFLIYKDYSEEMIEYSLEAPRGVISYFLLGEQYQVKKGLMTYKAEIKTESGEVLKEWEQKLWVKVIPFEEETLED